MAGLDVDVFLQHTKAALTPYKHWPEVFREAEVNGKGAIEVMEARAASVNLPGFCHICEAIANSGR